MNIEQTFSYEVAVMDGTRLQGAQYVRLAAGAAERVAPYLGVTPERIEELVLDLTAWPEGIRPLPLRARDGRLIAGDPVLLDASDAGLLFGNGFDRSGKDAVLVSWADVCSVQVLARE